MPTGPAEAIRYAERVAAVYAAASDELLRTIGERVTAGLDVDSDRARLSELQRLQRHSEQVVAQAHAAGAETAAAVVSDAYAAGVRSRSQVNQRALLALIGQSMNTLQQAGPAMLRWTDDVYRQVIAEVAISGMAQLPDRRAITARALDRFAALGVNAFTDRTGARWRVESYAEMATRTAIQQAHLAGTVDRLQSQGRDLVVVSRSPAGCPLCRPHEGQVFSLSGADDQYPPLSGAVGLFHPNCTHSVSAFVPGLTQDPPGTPLEAPQLYRARQRQRALERVVRESKRRVAAAEGVGDPVMVARQRELLSARQARLTGHLRSDPRLKSYVSRLRTEV